MTSTIRPATSADAPAIVILAERKAVIAGQPTIERDRVLGLAHRLIAEPAGAVYVAADDRNVGGFLAAVGIEHPMTGELEVRVLSWWLAPWAWTAALEQDLIDSAECFAIAIGAVAVVAPGEDQRGCAWPSEWQPVATYYRKPVPQPVGVEPPDLASGVRWYAPEVGIA